MTQVIGAFKNAMLGSWRVQASRWTVASSDLRLVEMPKRREPSAEWRLMMAQCTAHRDILTGGNDQAVGAFVAGGGDLTWHNPAPVPALPVNEPEPVAMPAVMYGMDEHGRYQAIPVPGGSVEGVHVHTVTMGAGPDGVEFSAEVTMDEESFQRIHALLVGQAEQALFADVGWVDIPAPSGSRTANLGRMLVDVERRVRDAAQMADQAAPLNDVVAVARAIHRMEKNLDKVDFRYRSTIMEALSAQGSSADFWLRHRDPRDLQIAVARQNGLHPGDAIYTRREPDSLAEELFNQTDRAILGEPATCNVAIGPFDSQDADLPPAIGNI
jgi:hypothetical protein